MPEPLPTLWVGLTSGGAELGGEGYERQPVFATDLIAGAEPFMWQNDRALVFDRRGIWPVVDGIVLAETANSLAIMPGSLVMLTPLPGRDGSLAIPAGALRAQVAPKGSRRPYGVYLYSFGPYSRWPNAAVLMGAEASAMALLRALSTAPCGPWASIAAGPASAWGNLPAPVCGPWDEKQPVYQGGAP